MTARRAAFVAALPPGLADREDALPARLANTNASAQSKLGQIIALVDELSALRAPHVACKEGCADCCRMNVQISSIEAARIEKATGRKARPVATSRGHQVEEFNGIDCPFLIERSCSIYDVRPVACRTHASFDVDPEWCRPDRWPLADLPMMKFTGVSDAVLGLVKSSPRAVIADIRDFFDLGDTEKSAL